MKKFFCSVILLSFLMLFGNNSLACTIFCASDKNVTLVGNNEDYDDKDAKVWFVPSDGEKHGKVYFGFYIADPQGGMNDQGLFIDLVQTSPVKKLAPSDFTSSLLVKVLEECSTLDQALDLSKKNIATCLGYSSIMIVDQYGSSAILSWDWNTNSLIIDRQDGRNQLLGYGEPILRTRFQKGDYDLSAEYFQKMLDDAHQGDSTIYSNVYDLKNKVVYLNYLHDFKHTVKFDLKTELRKGEHLRDVFSLFPQNQYNNLDSILDKSYPQSTLILMIVFALIFCSPFIIYFICLIIRVCQRKKPSTPATGPIPLIARIGAVLNSSICLLLIYYILKYSNFIYAYGLNMFGKAVSLLPIMIPSLAIIEMLLGIIIWKNKYWSVIERFYYLLLILASLFFFIIFKIAFPG